MLARGKEASDASTASFALAAVRKSRCELYTTPQASQSPPNRERARCPLERDFENSLRGRPRFSRANFDPRGLA